MARPISIVVDLAIDAVEREPQRPRADAVARQRMDDVLHEAGRDRDDGLLRDDGLKQIAQAVIDRRRSEERKRLGRAAERLVEALQ